MVQFILRHNGNEGSSQSLPSAAETDLYQLTKKK